MHTLRYSLRHSVRYVRCAPLYTTRRFTLDVTTTPAVPEPREWMLMLAGIGVIGVSAARKLGR